MPISPWGEGDILCVFYPKARKFDEDVGVAATAALPWLEGPEKYVRKLSSVIDRARNLTDQDRLWVYGQLLEVAQKEQKLQTDPARRAVVGEKSNILAKKVKRTTIHLVF